MVSRASVETHAIIIGLLMTKISKEEALKIAQISCLSFDDAELNAIIKQLEAVLTYAERVQGVASDAQEPSSKRINVFREDVVVRTDAQTVLAEAPDREQDYFVVPKVLDGDK
jgi:aspartyl/glutamyl-tRNA(Asn/Gln) amidotransferase C subunit